MSAANTLVLDTTGLSPIQPSGFVPPSQRARYSDPLVQSFLWQAFRGQFPRLESMENDSAVYRHENPATDSFASSVAAASIQDIPQAEVMRLLQGWITLRKIAMESTVPEGVRSLLMNLKIPNPRVAPSFYRVQGAPGGNKKLYVLIGFEGPAVPSVALEEGIAAMLNVPPAQLESLLATSMAPTGNTTRIHVLDPLATEAGKSQTKQPARIRNLAITGAAAALMVVALGTIWKMSGSPSGAAPTPERPPHAAQQTTGPIAPPEPAPVVPPAPQNVPAEAARPLAQPEPTAHSPLEEMSAGTPPRTTASGKTAPEISDDTNLSDLMAQ
jgi:hypothetical protein